MRVGRGSAKVATFGVIIFSMIQKIIKAITLCFVVLTLAACSKERSLYQGLAADEDGVVSIGIPDDGAKPPPIEVESTKDQLSSKELELINQWHEGETDKISFLVVDVENNKVIRSYYADKPQRLASISKITTAISALENVRNVEVPKVRNMLKVSNNGEASRYVRLAAKALDGLVLSTPHYSQAHSCPDEFLNDEPAAHVVLSWLEQTLPEVDWSNASYNDGAGCNYNNFMSSTQVSKILQYADELGNVFDGEDFEQLLSINGVDGTLKHKNLDHKGYIFGKTGTLNPNSNLSGYFYARRNGAFVKHYFSIFVQKKGGGQYSVNARRLIEELMRYWIDYYSSHPAQFIGDF